MLCVVAPVLHDHEVAVPPFSVSIALDPLQNKTDAGVMEAADGFTVTVTIVELSVLELVEQVTLNQ